MAAHHDAGISHRALCLSMNPAEYEDKQEITCSSSYGTARGVLQGLELGWEPVSGSTLALVEDVEGIVIGMSLSAISEQLMLPNCALKMQAESVTLRISELKKASPFQKIPALVHNTSCQKSDQSQLPGAFLLLGPHGSSAKASVPQSSGFHMCKHLVCMLSASHQSEQH
jgi:hypothetical protein